MTSTSTALEIYYSRHLASAVHKAIQEGKLLPLEVVTAYAQLQELYDQQMECGDHT